MALKQALLRAQALGTGGPPTLLVPRGTQPVGDLACSPGAYRAPGPSGLVAEAAGGLVVVAESVRDDGCGVRDMPVEFLTDEQATALGSFADEPTRPELERFFFLDDEIGS